MKMYEDAGPYPMTTKLIEPMTANGASTIARAMRRHAIFASVVILLGSALLLFARLGHYPLWDDEAITAMTARGVWRTGDTSARVDDHNILAYRNGLLIRGFNDRYTPPLQFYLLAPFIGLLGESNFVCRLPFAICGLITVGILLRWLWRHRSPPIVWWTAAVVILTNAEFFLFFRQVRYYGLATMLSTAVAYLYFHHDGRRRSTIVLSIALAALLASQYLNFATVVACLVVDYVIFGRKRRPLAVADWIILVVPQLAVGAIVCSIWNPLTRGAGTYESGHWLVDRVRLLWWNWRDLIACDFLIVPLLVLSPLLYFARRESALLRAPTALFVYVGALALCVATQVGKGGNAEVRYLAPALPICIGVAIVAIWGIRNWKRRLQFAAIAVALLTMFVQPTTEGSEPVIDSTSLSYYRELIHPQAEPYTPVIAWIRSHVSPGKSIYVRPEWMAYPLMFHAPQAVYAWQLTDPPTAPEYTNLPDIHFKGRVAPDYMIAFGPGAREVKEVQEKLTARGERYEPIDTIHVNWQDLYRPERVWRSFVTKMPKEGEEVYVYRRVKP